MPAFHSLSRSGTRGPHEIVWLISLALLLGFWIFLSFNIVGIPVNSLGACLVGFAIALIAFGLRPRCDGQRSGSWMPLIALPIVLYAGWIYFIKNFGSFDLNALVFHLRAGVSQAGVNDFRGSIHVYLTWIIVAVASASYLVRFDRRFMWVDRILVAPLVAFTPFASPTLLEAVETTMPREQSLLESYHDPAGVGAPLGRKKNLLLIYLESAEETFGRLDLSHDIYQDLRDLGRQGLRIRGIREVNGSGWTVAGFVASQCGIPLQSPGMFQGNKGLAKLRSVVPGTTCLGDVLREHGYTTEYLAGASPTFGGKGTFLRSHGYERIRGVEDFQSQVGRYVNSWGLYDDTVFAEAKKTVAQLSDSEQPFFFTLLTLAGHSPTGYPAKRCLEEINPMKTHGVLFGIRCTGFLVHDFISNLRQSDLLENTLVVIQSDHLSHWSKASEIFNGLERTNYFVAIGAGVEPREIEADAVMFDVYPTLLELMGFEVPGGSAGLGVSLVSEHHTLVSEVGLMELNEKVYKDNWLRSKMWQLD